MPTKRWDGDRLFVRAHDLEDSRSVPLLPACCRPAVSLGQLRAPCRCAACSQPLCALPLSASRSVPLLPASCAVGAAVAMPPGV
eukprot:7676555-Lingulodinium_polyedra.AAC.1